MKLSNPFLVGKMHPILRAFFVLTFVGFVPRSEATVYDLQEGDSLVKVNDAVGSGSAYGWTVAGVKHLNNQWLYYRIGSDVSVQPIDSIGTPTSVLNPNGKQLTTTYANSTLSVKVVFSLSDSLNPGESAFNQDITINNLSGGSLDLHFFQYSDYNLGGSSVDQSLQFSAIGGKRTAVQEDGSWKLTESVLPFPSPFTTVRYESAVDGHILTSLTDGSATTLNNTVATGPGDITYAFEWDRTMAAGTTLQITKLQAITVPEPSCAALLGLGIAAVSLARRRRQ